MVPLLLLLPVDLKAGVFDVTAELPSGGSPSWEECNAVPGVVGKPKGSSKYLQRITSITAPCLFQILSELTTKS